MSAQRTIKLGDIEPGELADLIREMNSEQQADFFRMVCHLAKAWPGTGWCGQSYDIARCLEVTGRGVITKLAEHVLGFDEMLQVVKDCEESFTADGTYSALATECRRVIAKATGAA